MIFRFCINILWVLFTLSCADLQIEEEDVSLEMITKSSPCSATCGLGIKSETLCMLNGSKTDLVEKESGTSPEVTQECRVRKVNCLISWQCGLRTLTVTVGQKLNIDCVGEVLKEMGPYAWRVSWGYAPGVITSDNSLFRRLVPAKMDHILLDPIEEKHAGTYRCVVLDAALRRVKRIYWGVRVLPPGVFNLDTHHSTNT